jgi:hypothetical protein
MSGNPVTPLPEVRALWRPEQFTRVTNGGFETNTTGWSVSAGINAAGTSITRITTDFWEGSACGSLVCGTTDGGGVNFDLGADRYFTEATYGSIYVAVVWLKLVSGSGRARLILGSEGTTTDRATTTIDLVEAWRPYVVRWFPSGDRTDAQLAITNGSAEALTVRIDAVRVYQMDAFSQCENGTFETDTTGWSAGAGLIAAAATSVTRTAGGFGGSWCGRVVTSAASALSGVTFDLGTRLFTSGRTYRLRVAAKSVAGATSARLALGNAADNTLQGITLTSDFAWYTCDWTPAANRTDVELAVLNATAASRTVDIDEVEVYEALDDLGTDVGSGLSWNRSLGSPGSITCPVLSVDGTYDPRYTSGPLYGALAPGKRLLGRATYSNALYPLFYGTIRSIEAPARGGLHATILADDIIADLGRATISQDFEESQPYRYARRAAVFMAVAGVSDVVGLASVETSRWSGTTLVGIEGNTFYDATDGTQTALDYLGQLNDATASVHYCAPSVHANLGWAYTVVDRATLTDTSSDFTIDEDFEDVSGIKTTDDTLENRQEVTWQAYEKLPPPSHDNGFGVVAEAFDPGVYGQDGSGDEPYLTYTRDEYGTDADTPEPRFLYFIRGAWRRRGRIDRKKAKKKGYKLKRGSRIFPNALVPYVTTAGDVLSLVVDFSVPVSGPNVFMGGSATINVVYREQRPNRIVFDLITVGAGTMDYLGIAGTPWVPHDELTETRYGTVYDPTLVPYDGPDINSPYIPAKGDAEGLGDHRNWRYGQSRLAPTIVDHNQFPRDLTMQVTDHVTLSADRWRIDGLLLLATDLAWTVGSGGLDWRLTITTEELPTHTDWLTLDHATLGLDENVVLAY